MVIDVQHESAFSFLPMVALNFESSTVLEITI